jgi:exopolysaccharide production protein ExoZ
MRYSPFSEQIEAIQVARAIAAMLVVAVHSIDLGRFRHLRHGDPLGWLSGGAVYSDFGASGVDFFFVISGFVMAMVLTKAGATQANRFFDDRFLRIIPLYWLMTFICAVEMMLLHRPFGAENLAMSVTLWPLTNPGKFAQPILFVGWTLAFEFAFYVTLLPALRVSHSQRLAVAAAPAAMLAGIGLIVRPQLDLAAMWLRRLRHLLV